MELFKNIFFILFFFGTVNLSISQENLDFVKNTEIGFQYEGTTIETLGQFSSTNDIPFWLTNNKNGRKELQTNILGLVTNQLSYALTNKSKLNLYTGIVASDGFNDAVRIDELALTYTNSWLYIELGKKQSNIFSDELSTTNKNFLLSNNAQPMPGLYIKSNSAMRLFSFLELDEIAIGHYIMDDERYVKNTRVHFKKIAFNLIFDKTNTLSLKMQHIVQWAGTSPQFGKLPSNFNSFLDVFFASQPNDSNIPGEDANALGNHLGSYFFEYQFLKKNAFSFYYEHPFEDGSSSGFSNFLDGIYGISFIPFNKRFFSKLIYEFISTKNQSFEKTSSGADNYFNNGIYRTGWIYENRIIGLPLFITNFNQNLDENYRPIIANTIIAHHLGASGNFSNVKWNLKFTYVKNKGLRSSPLNEEILNFYSYTSFSYQTVNFGEFSFFGGLDTGSKTPTNLGASLGYKYEF